MAAWPGWSRDHCGRARAARSPWLMFLHAGTVLDANWIEDVRQFMQNAALSEQPQKAQPVMCRGLTALELFRLKQEQMLEQNIYLYL